MTTFPAAQDHGALEPLFPDVWRVRGSFRVGPGMSIPRNMIVLREGRALTVVNAVRLSAAGEAALAELGEVKHLVKLGHFHGLDDPYYRDRFRPTFWAPKPADADTRELASDGASPLERARPFRFEGTAGREGALLVAQDAGNLLVTCDSVQNWESAAGSSFLGGIVVRLMGFIEPAKIGPIWVKKLTDEDPSKVRPDFERLLGLDFTHLVGGHGELLRDGAKAAVKASCARTLGMH